MLEVRETPPALSEVRPAVRSPDRIFFSIAGLWFVMLALIGFSPSFYFRVSDEPLPIDQVVHGVIYSAWVLLFLLQALLIASRRVRWHTTLGTVAVLVLILMIPVGFHVVLVKTAAGLKSIDAAPRRRGTTR